MTFKSLSGVGENPQSCEFDDDNPEAFLTCTNLLECHPPPLEQRSLCLIAPFAHSNTPLDCAHDLPGYIAA